MMKCATFLCSLLLACAMLTGAMAEMTFAEHALEDAFLYRGTEWTENGYRSKNMAIEITALRSHDSDVYVADLKMRTVECLRRSFGGDAWNSRSERLEEHAAKSGAILALTGDNGHHFKAGYEVGNGRVWRERGNQMRDLCVIYADGSMQTHYAPVDHERIAQEAAEGKVWQTFVFGPALLDENGKAIMEFPTSDIKPKNPRAVIGYYAPGHYCLVQVDGRTTDSKLEPGRKNHGMRLEELAQFMEELGCKAAYNLDGGQTAALWFRDGLYSTPYMNGRAMGDAIVICEPSDKPESPDEYLVE